MEIFEMLSFDIGEFVTSPAGIIMMVGIVLLIVGIVLMFMGKGKGDASEKAAVENVAETSETKEMPIPVANPTEEPKVEETPVVNAAPVVEATPVVVEATPTTESVTTPAVEPIDFNANENVAAPAVVAETLDMTTEIKPESLNGIVENSTPVVESLDAPVVETPVPAVVEATPVVETPAPAVVEATPVVETPVSVYGGANPEVKNVFEEKPREIYGGANPLENTAPIPTQTVKEAYSGAMSATPVAETPAPAVVEATPVVETPAPAVVEATPVVETPAPAVVETTPVVETPAPAVVEAPEVKKEEIETLEF